MNKTQIQHTGYFLDCYPVDSDTLIINLNTGKDVSDVSIYVGDPFSAGISTNEEKWVGEELKMSLSMEHKDHLTWSISVHPKYKRLKYHFKISADNESLYLFADGLYDSLHQITDDQMIERFIFPWLNPNDVNKVPAWVSDTIWYQIFPDRFCRGNSAEKRFKTSDWCYQKDTNYFTYYGGDIAGIEQKLPYISQMGFSGIYLTPVLMGNSNHKYDTVDYNQIDPDFGTEQEFIHLIQKAHEMGIRVMIDAVFNHVSRDFMPWADVMEKGKESKYFDWFFINKFPISKNHDASYHGDYYTFAFVDAMPKLNTNNPEVVDYLLNLTKHWTKVWKIDGIRFDVGNEIAHSFIKTLHYELKKINPDIFLLGEIWHNAFPWLLGDEYDSVMNYPFLSNMNNFWDNKQLNATDFKYMINKCYSLYYKQVNRVLFNMLDSHDTTRLFQRCKQDENLFYQQLSILMTMQGTPSIYYGTEIEMIGEGSKENRKCMPWDDIEKGVYQDKIDSLRQLIAIRNKYPQARSEQIRWYTENTERLIHYSKQLEGYEELDVYINASDQAVQISREVKTIYSRGVSDSKLMPGGVMIQTK